MSGAPRFELTRILAEGTREAPEIVPVMALPAETRMDRRGFLGTGISASAAAASLLGASCDIRSGRARPPRRPAEDDGSTEPPPAPSAASSSAATNDAPRPTSPCDTGKAHRSRVGALASVPGYSIVISGSDDGLAKLWRVDAASLVATRQGTSFEPAPAMAATLNPAACGFVAASPDGKTMATVSRWEINLWSVAGGAHLGKLGVLKPGEQSSYEELRSLAITNEVVTSSARKEIALWRHGGRDLPAPKDGPQLLAGHGDTVFALVATPDGKTLVSASRDGTVRFWTIEVGKGRARGNAIRLAARAIAVSRDGATLAVAKEGEIALFRVSDAKATGVMKGAGLPAGEPVAIAFAAEGRSLAVATAGAVHVIAVPDGSLVTKVDAPGVSALAVADPMVVTGTLDGRIALRRLADLAIERCVSDPRIVTAGADPAIPATSLGEIRRETSSAACGTPIPPGATCTCNCVPGKSPAYAPPPYTPPPYGGYGGGGGSYCSCNKVCTCVPVRR